LSEDVAGATFMAAGSSAPELFTSLASVTADNEVGAGTIVGSAVFNILIIIALSAAFAKRVLKIDWRPLIRDSVFYAISIIMFTIFVADYKIYIYEAIILLVMYVVYVVLMKFNPQLMKLMAGEYNETQSNREDENEDLLKHKLPSNREFSTRTCLCWQIFIFVLRWILLIFSFPFIWVFSWTVPNCSTEKYKKYYTLTFILSIVWIAVLSFGMVILVSRTGCILSIDSYTMGLVIVAIGTSIPDALSSIFAVRDGHGDMAVSNAIGSNIFDINLGLGLPYLIRILI
ncbi:uncharacterized protein TRIADDRAFT_14805, partial [Trichoplax adhaerens]